MRNSLLGTGLLLLLTLSSSVSQAQDANCSAIYNDYSPSLSGNLNNNGNSHRGYQRCYIDQAYNAALVAQGSNPDYRDLLNQVCGIDSTVAPSTRASCSRSSLILATNKFMGACSASIDAESANGNVLQIGKVALEIFFADPIRIAYCSLDPTAVELPPPAINLPAYCLACPAVANSNNRFITNMVIYLTSGSLRVSQSPFFEGLDRTDTCSVCSQRALNVTVGYLATNLMPRIGPFYTSEFV
ncbi:hypothetical protein BGX31_003942, partial [Mortierella sp. GBA43]